MCAWGGVKAQDFELGTKYSGTDLADKVFAIVNETESKAFYSAGGNALNYGNFSDAFKLSNSAVAFKFVSLANDADASVRGYYYLIAITPSGTEDIVYGSPGHLNSQEVTEGWCCFIQWSSNGDIHHGQDMNYGAVWDIQYSEGEGYSIKNIGTGKYLKDATPAKYDSPTYFSLYTYSECVNVFSWEDLTFDSGKQEGKGVVVDNEKRKVVDERGYAPYWCHSAGWNLPEGSRDLSGFRYLVIYSTQNASDHEGSIYITDGVNSMQGNDYSSGSGGDYPSVPAGTGLWLNAFSNQHIAVVDLQWIANTDKYGNTSECKYVDITNVTSFGIGASNEGTFVDFAFLTNTKPNLSGDYVRAMGAFNKYGTICLPFDAVCSGAEVYEIVGQTGDALSLNRHWGKMEAGKPYFYKTVESQIGYWDDALKFKDEENVYFYKVGLSNEYNTVANNGLVGTFSEITLTPNDNYYVLSNNTLYKVDAGATGENAVKIGANKAYVDISQIVNKSRGAVFLDFDEPTGVNEVRGQKEDVRSDFFNLAGQRVAQPTKGLYIVNGKKVIIK